MSRPIALVCAGVGDLSATLAAARIEAHEVPARPGRATLDPLLAELAGRRLLVCGTDADLAAVVLRLLRTDRLGRTEVGFVCPGGSVFSELWSLPADPSAAVTLAVRGSAAGVPVLRDDSGGVLLGRGVLAPVDGVAYCDDVNVLRGKAASLTVEPVEPDGLRVRVSRRKLFGERASTTTGRALQIGCAPVHPVHDGVRHTRPVQRWTWYRHTEDLALVRIRNQAG